ncbi:hypothetical protein Tdes44962_MAKER05364, partial [Teratosphaeria destructans]
SYHGAAEYKKRRREICGRQYRPLSPVEPSGVALEVKSLHMQTAMPSTPETTHVPRLNTPPTPLHGARHDKYQPYSPRRSSRATAQRNPYSSQNGERSPRAASQRHTTPPPTLKRTRFARAPTQLSSPPSSPASPARTRRTPPQHQLNKTPRKGLLSSARKAIPSATRDSFSESDNHKPSSLAPAAADPANMLPTPSKTPKKRNAAAVSSAARVLSFQPNDPNDVMPTPRRIRKHGRSNSASGFDLYDDNMDAQNDPNIPIFTDTNARVPELDQTEDNPFVGPRHVPPKPKRTQRIKAQQEKDMEEAAKRDEGVIFNFRGKKIFRRFSDPEQDRSSSAGTETSFSPGQLGQRSLKRSAGASAARPLTRSSIKPRLLFPSEEQLRERDPRADDVDEEATTDIEMNSPGGSKAKMHDLRTPRKGHSKQITPPATARSTRAMKTSPDVPDPINEDEPEPMSVGSDAPVVAAPKTQAKSPFDSWQRTKPSRKRVGDAGEVVGSKRTRRAVLGSPA